MRAACRMTSKRVTFKWLRGSNQFMDNSGKRRVLAILDDLFFTVKIGDAARRAGVEIDIVATEAAAFEKAAEARLIIMDLNCTSVQPLQIVENLKDLRPAGSKLIGYLSHVQVDLKVRAQEAGCDEVLARSALSDTLPKIMRSYAETE